MRHVGIGTVFGHDAVVLVPEKDYTPDGAKAIVKYAEDLFRCAAKWKAEQVNGVVYVPRVFARSDVDDPLGEAEGRS